MSQQSTDIKTKDDTDDIDLKDLEEQKAEQTERKENKTQQREGKEEKSNKKKKEEKKNEEEEYEDEGIIMIMLHIIHIYLLFFFFFVFCFVFNLHKFFNIKNNFKIKLFFNLNKETASSTKNDKEEESTSSPTINIESFEKGKEVHKYTSAFDDNTLRMYASSRNDDTFGTWVLCREVKREKIQKVPSVHIKILKTNGDEISAIAHEREGLF